MVFSQSKYLISLITYITISLCLSQQPLDFGTAYDNLYPRELMGMFLGETVFLSDGNLVEACTLLIRRPEKKFAYFYTPGPCANNSNLSVEDFLGSVILQSSAIGETFKMQCGGKGFGYFWVHAGDSDTRNEAIAIRGFACGVFERKGDFYYQTFGYFMLSPVEAKCPPSARAEPNVDPDTRYKAVFKALDDTTRNITEELYSCQ